MTRCRYWRRRMPEAVYGELDATARERFMRHLARCEGCAALYEGMAEAVRKMEARPAPDREPEFWDGYWNRLEERMAQETLASGTPEAARVAKRVSGARRFHGPLPLPTWAYAAAGALVFLALGIFLGRTLFRPQGNPATLARTTPSPAVPSGPATLGPGTIPASLSDRASRYLRRSRVLLLAVVNSDPRDEGPSGLTLAFQKRTSQELLAEAAVLKKGLGSSDRRLESLVSDLEWILIQIAHLTPESGTAGIEVIKAGVESRDILFKINVDEVRRSPGKPGGERTPESKERT